MRKVSTALTLDKLKNNPNATEEAKSMVTNDSEVLESFLTSSEHNSTTIQKGNKKKIFHELVEKVVNARFSEEFRGYREKYTARGSENKETNLVLRGELDVIGSRKSSKKQSGGVRMNKDST